jgi:hypothetical protein
MPAAGGANGTPFGAANAGQGFGGLTGTSPGAMPPNSGAMPPATAAPDDTTDGSANATTNGATESSGRSNSGAKADTPIRRALSDLQGRNFDACVNKLDAILQVEPRNAQAHYLKAVVNVITRHYTQAAIEYRAVLQNSPTAELSSLAQSGLSKLAR